MFKFKSLPVMILACFMFGGCSNDESSSEPQADEVPVTFRVSTLSVENQPMDNGTMTRAASTTSEKPIGEVVNTIHYYIYNGYNLSKSGVIEFDPENENAPEDFGTFKVNLKPGTNTAYFFAGGMGDGTFLFQSMEQNSQAMNLIYQNKELFYYTGDFIVENKAKEFDVTVNRVCGAIRINITDEIPENVAKVEYKFKDYEEWRFSRTSYNIPSYQNITKEASIKNNKLEQFDYYLMALPTTVESENRNLSFLIYDEDDNLISERTVEITIQKNKRTVISGNLFSALTGQGFTITVNDLWDDDILVPLE